MAAMLVVAGGLAACGGSSNDQDPSVSGMAATPAQYGRTAVWSISGLNLDKGINFVIASGSCDGLSEVIGGTAFQHRQLHYRCLDDHPQAGEPIAARVVDLTDEFAKRGRPAAELALEGRASDDFTQAVAAAGGDEKVDALVEVQPAD